MRAFLPLLFGAAILALSYQNYNLRSEQSDYERQLSTIKKERDQLLQKVRHYESKLPPAAVRSAPATRVTSQPQRRARPTPTRKRLKDR